MKQSLYILYHKLLRCIVFIFLLFLVACDHGTEVVRPEYHRIIPDYERLELYATNDTISFPLDTSTYNDIKSFNVFRHQGQERIAFYDRRSQSINIYSLQEQFLEKKLSLKRFFGKHQLYKTSVFVSNFDTILIANKTSLYLFDSAGVKRRRIEFLKNPPYTWAVLESDNRPVLSGTKLFATVRPNVNYKLLKAVRGWYALYEFDLFSGKTQLHYKLPGMYRTNHFGYQYMDYNFCYNHKGKFVFSFPADTLIYETDLSSHHKSFFAASRFQNKAITPLSRQELSMEAGNNAYLTNYAYGPLFYDPYRKCYLRVVKQPVVGRDLQNRQNKRKSTILLLDSSFKIIGENDLDAGIGYKSMFATPAGVYARVNPTNEYAIQFVRLHYRNIERKNLLTKQY